MSIYPSPPNNRFAYDVDGSLIKVYNGSFGDLTGNYTSTQLAALNSDKAVTGAIGIAYGVSEPQASYICVIFPEARTVTHAYWADSTTSSEATFNYTYHTMQYSTDTTNGQDGTWTNIPNGQIYNRALPLFPKARSSISAFAPALTNVAGMRVYRYNYDLYGGTRYHSFHIYGDRPSSMQRLAIWHPVNDYEVDGTHFDTGDTYRGLTTDIDFRVKNLDTTLTANTITLSTSMNQDWTPTFASQITYAYDGGAFGATASVGNLTAGSISNTCTLRVALANDSAIVTGSARLVASAASWT